MPNCISTRRSSQTALSAGVNLEPNPSPTLSATRLAAGAVPLTLPIGINSVEPSALALSNIDKDVLFALILRIRAEKRVSERLRRGEPLGVVEPEQPRAEVDRVVDIRDVLFGFLGGRLGDLRCVEVRVELEDEVGQRFRSMVDGGNIRDDCAIW
jgi:hypothetical protein